MTIVNLDRTKNQWGRKLVVSVCVLHMKKISDPLNVIIALQAKVLIMEQQNVLIVSLGNMLQKPPKLDPRMKRRTPTNRTCPCRQELDIDDHTDPIRCAK